MALKIQALTAFVGATFCLGCQAVAESMGPVQITSQERCSVEPPLAYRPSAAQAERDAISRLFLENVPSEYAALPYSVNCLGN